MNVNPRIYRVIEAAEKLNRELTAERWLGPAGNRRAFTEIAHVKLRDALKDLPPTLGVTEDE